MGKLLTVIIPAYNSQMYLERAVNSLLPYIKLIEVIIVNDGSNDDTAAIAAAYVQKYQDSVILINKENGGHGSAINAGMKLARGLYVKVLDSDDYFAAEQLNSLLQLIQQLSVAAELPDLIFTDYTLEILKQVYRQNHSLLTANELYPTERNNKFFYIDNKLRQVLPANKLFTWQEVKKWSFTELLIMHTLCYRRDFLQNLHLTLPEGVFYEDNYYSLIPLQTVETMYYLPVNLYMYYIGRQGQSVNLQKIIQNYQHQVKVIKAMLADLKFGYRTGQPIILRDLTIKHMARMYEVCQLIYLMQPNPEHLAALQEVKEAFNRLDPQLWHYVKKKRLVIFLNFACKYLLSLAGLILKLLRRLRVINA